MKIIENLYAYIWKGNDNNCNSFLYANVLDGKQHILIDPGHIITSYFKEKGYENLVKEIESDGLNLADIGLIYLTHAHPDHFESAAKFKEKSGAKIAIHEQDKLVFELFRAGSVDIVLKEGPLAVEGVKVDKMEVIHTPGHSAGETCLYWPAVKALAAGDVVFYRSCGRTDLPGGDGRQLIHSIERLSKLDIEYLLCGHPYQHPGVIQGSENVKQNFKFLLNNMGL
jgi:glyoxylase-like metal-dependent hydrolase (beta-lactamase superfamily II)